MTVAALVSPRFCRISVKRSPGCRHTSPSVGWSSPVISRKRVVFPAPFRPTIPQRSPAET